MESLTKQFYIPRRGEGRRQVFLLYFRTKGQKGMNKLTTEQLEAAYIQRRLKENASILQTV